MENLTITKEAVETAFNRGGEIAKKLLTDLFPEVFVTDPYLKACKKLGIKPKPILEDRSDRDEVSADAYYRLTICIRAKNMIGDKLWEYVLDGQQKHWFPRWTKNKAGFGLTDMDFGSWDSITAVGESLEYRSYELMLEGVKEFDVYYQDYLN